MENLEPHSLAYILNKSIIIKNLCDRRLLKGKCKRCLYKFICGGCRATAFSAFGDYLEEDPQCIISVN